MDSASVVVEAAAPESGAWTTCLARAAMAGHLDAAGEGLTIEDHFLDPRDAADRTVAWPAEAGHEVDVEPLVDVLTSDPDPSPTLDFAAGGLPGRKSLLQAARPAGGGAPVTLPVRCTQ